MDLFPESYKQYFRCYPVSQMRSGGTKASAIHGGKIYVPHSALYKLTMMRISYPMLFEIRSEDTKKKTHGGVLEFTAEEGRVYLPDWMFGTLGNRIGGLVRISSVTLELGSFVKIQPQSVAFLEITDPKAVLETALRQFSTLTVGDVFQISYNDRVYEIKVLEVKPENDRQSICVVETDLEVDFAPPVGYTEPKKENKPSVGPASSVAQEYNKAATKPITGVKLSGKKVEVDVSQVDTSIYSQRDAPALELPDGELFFGFPVVPLVDSEEPSKFKGEGNVLRTRKRKLGS